MTYSDNLKLFIDGAWQGSEGRDTAPVINPATAKTIAQIPLASAADLDTALGAAQRAFPLWRDTPTEKRAAILLKTSRLLKERASDIGALLTQEQGKPLAEAKGEVMGAASLFEWYGEEIKRDYGRTLVRPVGTRSIVTHQPVGVTATFTPWNFPIYLLAKKVAAALAAGCSVISKPPEETPACCLAVAHALEDAGLPGGVFQLVHGVPDMVSRHLIASPIVRKVSFTGSVGVGQQLMKLAAEDVKRLTLELGGHAPVIVFDDVDLDRTLDKLVPQKFRNAGQVCVSPTRFHVHQDIYDRFVTGFAERTKNVAVGNGMDDGTAMGPLAHERRLPAVEQLINNARDKGARVMAGGTRGDGGYFYRPTLLADVPMEADIMHQEPFGPVAIARPFADMEEAIEEANRLPFGLAAFAFTNDLRRANILGDRIEAGMVGINNFAVSSADAPFGGVKHSGFGSEGGIEGLRSYQVTKAIHMS